MNKIMLDSQTLIFEQPLNELIRACLRLEHLFKLIDSYQQDNSAKGHRIIMQTLGHIIDVTDRPDIRSKLNNALIHQSTSLSQLLNLPNIDQDKLRQTLDQLGRFCHQLQTSHGRFGHELRNNEFLAMMRQYQANPGGGCDFALPAYQAWLTRPAEARAQALDTWLAHFDGLRAVVELLLMLVRTSEVPQTLVAAEGFYQQALDANQKWQLVQVMLAQDSELYPEISVGRHRLVVRFYRLADMCIDNPKSTPVQQAVTFQLCCCKS